MYEWNKSVQKMLDIIEDNLTESLTLDELSQKLNYSSYYCTRQFHKYVGVSLRNYIRLRKLSASVFDLRDTLKRIIDIAFKYDYSSQEAYSRSFTEVYGISPANYRKMPHPLPLFSKRNTYNPYLLGIKRDDNKKSVHEVKVSIQMIPNHQFIGLRDMETDSYYDFWLKQEETFNRDCYEVSGLLESIKSYNGVVGGWFYKNNKKGYLFGVEVPVDESFIMPDYFEKIFVPESLYVVFHYPPYDYDQEDAMVEKHLKEKMLNWNPHYHGYAYNYTRNPIYQRHNPKLYGQAILHPIKIINRY